MTDVKCQQLKIQLNDSLTISAEMLALTALSFHLARDNITHALTHLLTHTLTHRTFKQAYSQNNTRKKIFNPGGLKES